MSTVSISSIVGRQCQFGHHHVHQVAALDRDRQLLEHGLVGQTRWFHPKTTVLSFIFRFAYVSGLQSPLAHSSNAAKDKRYALRESWPWRVFTGSEIFFTFKNIFLKYRKWGRRNLVRCSGSQKWNRWLPKVNNFYFKFWSQVFL